VGSWHKAVALQSFIEKVTIFWSAIKYVNVDLSQTTSSSDVQVQF
jgi:hypothetical protein